MTIEDEAIEGLTIHKTSAVGMSVDLGRIIQITSGNARLHAAVFALSEVAKQTTLVLGGFGPMSTGGLPTINCDGLLLLGEPNPHKLQKLKAQYSRAKLQRNKHLIRDIEQQLRSLT